MKSLLDEKDKMIHSLKKKLKMPSTKHPQTTELVALEQEKETFWKEALDYKAKFLQLEKEKMEWSQEKVELVTRAMVLSPTAGTGSTTEDIVHSMSQVSLKEGEIKGLKENMEKLEQEVRTKDEKISQVQKEKVVLQEKINKLNSRLRGKSLLQGAKHIIWDSIAVEAENLDHI
jgi:predicted  nucleic acid-binding Zn-ribbon protein